MCKCVYKTEVRSLTGRERSSTSRLFFSKNKNETFVAATLIMASPRSNGRAALIENSGKVTFYMN